MAPLVPNGKWTWKFDRCITCGTIKRKHQGKGLCTRCYLRQFNQKPEIMERARARSKKQYENIKNTPQYKAYCRKRARLRLAIRRIERMAKREFFHADHRLFEDMGAKYRCQVCPDHMTCTSLPSERRRRSHECRNCGRAESARSIRSRRTC
jgi:hypothetical protein